MLTSTSNSAAPRRYGVDRSSDRAEIGHPADSTRLFLVRGYLTHSNLHQQQASTGRQCRRGREWQCHLTYHGILTCPSSHSSYLRRLTMKESGKRDKPGQRNAHRLVCGVAPTHRPLPAADYLTRGSCERRGPPGRRRGRGRKGGCWFARVTIYRIHRQTPQHACSCCAILSFCY